MCIGETTGAHMGIDLRGGDVAVAEHFLHGAKIRAVVKQMGGEGVP